MNTKPAKEKPVKAKKPTRSTPSKQQTTNPRVFQNIAVVVLLFVTTALFAPALNYQFINFDDPSYVIDNLLIRDLSFKGLIEISTTPVLGMYNPLPFVVYALEYAVSGLNPKTFHLVNLLSHLLATLVLYRFTYRLSNRFEVAFIVATLFALHPTHVSVVIWVSQLKTSMYVTFYLLALTEYVNYIRSDFKKKHLFFSMAWFLPALLSKPTAVTLAPMLLAIDYYLQRKISFRLLLEKSGFFLISLVFGILTLYTHKVEGDNIYEISQSYSLINSIAVSNYSLVFYFEKFLFPLNLSSIYSYPDDGVLPLKYYIELLVIPVIGVITYFSGKFKREMIFGLLYFIISISVVLRVVPSGEFGAANRYTYNAYTGLFFILAQLVVYIRDQRIRVPVQVRKYAFVFLGVYCVFFVWRTTRRVKVWESTITVFDDVIKKGHGIPVVYNQRALAKRDNGDYQGALEDLITALQLDPKYIDGRANLAALYYETKQYDKALKEINQVLKEDPKRAAAYNCRGGIYLAKGDQKSALYNYNMSIRLDTTYKEAYYNRGYIKYTSGDTLGAVKDWSIAAEKGLKEANRALFTLSVETT